jgi:hypothetical protein
LTYIQNNENNNIVFRYYKDNIYNINNNECFHTLYIDGNNKENILYAYIDYFNVVKYIVILSKEYKGDDITYKYQYDLINNIEIDKGINLDCLRNDIINLKHSLIKYFTDDFDRFMRLSKNLKNSIIL